MFRDILRARRGRLVAALLALVTGLSLMPGLSGVARADGPPLDPGPVKILLTGDSITQGFDGDYTWRYRLWQEFRRQGVPVDFVGSRTLPFVAKGYATSTYLDPGFDSDHFAIGGVLLESLAQLIGAEASQQKPDVVFLEAGVNDLRLHHDPNRTAAALRAWISNLRAVRPQVRIIVSTVLEARDRHVRRLPSLIGRYNQLLRGVAAEQSTAESPITVADTSNGWSLRRDTYADIHPNPTGETLIAQRVAEAMQQVGILPGTPQVYRSVVWARNLVPSVVVRRGRAVVTWDGQSLSSARLLVRRQGGPGTVLRKTFHRGRFTTGPLVAGARYEFRLKAFRGRMTSPWGPVTRLVAPRLAPVGRLAVRAHRVTWSKVHGARAYRVQYLVAGHWRTRAVRRNHLDVRVQEVRVVAVNAFCSSLPATATRH